MSFRFHIPQYLTRRAADWAARGFNRNSDRFRGAQCAPRKFWGDDGRAAFRKLGEEVDRSAHKLGAARGRRTHHAARNSAPPRHAGDAENRLDALVRLHTPLPPAKIGRRQRPPRRRQQPPHGTLLRPQRRPHRSADPAGYVTTAYDPVFKLSDDRKRYLSAPSDTPTPPPAPGLPFSLVFRAEPGREDTVLRIASAYETASKRRSHPPRSARRPSQGMTISISRVKRRKSASLKVSSRIGIDNTYRPSVTVHVLATQAEAFRPRPEVMARQVIDAERLLFLRLRLRGGSNTDRDLMLARRHIGRCNSGYRAVRADPDAGPYLVTLAYPR